MRGFYLVQFIGSFSEGESDLRKLRDIGCSGVRGIGYIVVELYVYLCLRVDRAQSEKRLDLLNSS